jgi:xanthine dehydrogenase accessory factor
MPTMFHDLQALLARLHTQPAVLVTVESTQGSAPRDAGTWMAVFAQGDDVATIGGGRLELDVQAEARAFLAQSQHGAPSWTRRFALGSSLGQCCGGVVWVRFEPVTAEHASVLESRLMGRLRPVALFGGGHVGHALVRVLSHLPFAVQWMDSRDGVFPTAVPLNVQCEHSEPVQAGVADVVPGASVFIMSFSHAEDLDIVAACLKRVRERNDLPFIGLIGSASKWATFRHRLESRGFTPAEVSRVTCPIGLPGIAGKEPGVIAIAVAAQLLLLNR